MIGSLFTVGGQWRTGYSAWKRNTGSSVRHSLVAANKLEAYYWNVYALIFESGDILALGHPDFSLSDANTAAIAQMIHAALPFRDRSRLYAEILSKGAYGANPRDG